VFHGRHPDTGQLLGRPPGRRRPRRAGGAVGPVPHRTYDPGVGATCGRGQLV